jgi:hypothetical protein
MDVRMVSTSRKRATTVYTTTWTRCVLVHLSEWTTKKKKKIKSKKHHLKKKKTIRKELKRSMTIDDLGTHFDP